MTLFKVINILILGYNVTVMAYGQTSSGKTHTIGTEINDKIEPEYEGIISRSSEFILSNVKANDEINLKCTFVEIYNEELFDLQDNNSTPIIREDAQGRILLSGVQETNINTIDELESTSLPTRLVTLR